MELYQLASFIAVAQTGSLSKAAVLRNISLSGISKHIKLFEEDLGIALFLRNAKGMDLTEDGRLVLQHAEKIYRNIDCLYALAKQATTIRIGLNLSPDFIELSRFKSLLEQRHPNQKTVFGNHNSSVLLVKLASGELDLCLAFGEIPERFQKLFIRKIRMPLMLPLSMGDGEDLTGKCWIVNTADCPFKPPLEEFWKKQGIIPQSVILSQDLSRKEMVAQGLGVGFLEPQDGLYLIQNGVARQHGEFFLEIGLWVVFQEDRLRPIADFLQHYVQLRYESLESSCQENIRLNKALPLDRIVTGGGVFAR
jgi:DNA-binding transcriptional LysR family regulator